MDEINKKINTTPILQAGLAVVVRSWADEPVELWLYSIENNGNTGIVGLKGGRHRIGVPIRDIYPSDVKMCEMARDAHSRGDRLALQQLYDSWRK